MFPHDLRTKLLELPGMGNFSVRYMPLFGLMQFQSVLRAKPLHTKN
ncbi:hypothetical protein [Anatilimnocola aggregata]|nr:hypothetical protein [Anatilimnocola aggregata]